MSAVALGYYQPHLTAPRAQSYAFPPTPTVPALLYTTARKSLSVAVEAAAPATQIRWSVVLPPGAEPADPNNPLGKEHYFDDDTDKIYDYVGGVRTLMHDPEAHYQALDDYFSPLISMPNRILLSDYIPEADRMNRAKKDVNRDAFSAALAFSISEGIPLALDITAVFSRLFLTSSALVDVTGGLALMDGILGGGIGYVGQASAETPLEDVCIFGDGFFSMLDAWVEENSSDVGGVMVGLYGSRMLFRGDGFNHGVMVDRFQGGNAWAPKGSNIAMRYCAMVRPPVITHDGVGSGGIRISAMDGFDARYCWGFCNDDALQAVPGANGGDVTRFAFRDNLVLSLAARHQVAGLQNRAGGADYTKRIMWGYYRNPGMRGRVRIINHDSVGIDGEAMRVIMVRDADAQYVGGNRDDAILGKNNSTGWMKHIFLERPKPTNYGSRALLADGAYIDDFVVYDIDSGKPADDTDPPIIFNGPKNSGMIGGKMLASDATQLIQVDRKDASPSNNAIFRGFTVEDIREGQAVFAFKNSNNAEVGPDVVLKARAGEHGRIAVIGTNAIATTIDGVDATGLNVQGNPITDNGVGTIVGEITT